MKDFTQGHSYEDMHGAGHNGGAVASTVSSGYNPPKPKSGIGGVVKAPKAAPPYGGVYKKVDYEADVAQKEHNDVLQSNAVHRHEMDRQFMAGEDFDKTATAMNVNGAQYALGKAGNNVAAGRVQDTDAVIAASKGAPEGTEYAANLEEVPGTNSAKKGYQQRH